MANVDLNDPKYMLQFIDDPIEKFNMFIKKWCPDYAHLIDSDDNDGEEIRDMIFSLQSRIRSNRPDPAQEMFLNLIEIYKQDVKEMVIDYAKKDGEKGKIKITLTEEA